MPLRLPTSSTEPDLPDSSRRWLWVALLTGLLALLLAGSAMARPCGRSSPGPLPAARTVLPVYAPLP